MCIDFAFSVRFFSLEGEGVCLMGLPLGLCTGESVSGILEHNGRNSNRL